MPNPISIPQTPARLEFTQVSAGYNGKPVIENITFDIPHGAQVAVVGPNGAGKSTLFKAIVSLIPLQQGTIRIHGLSLSQHQDCVAYIPQREDVDWQFPATVADVVMMGRYGKFGWFNRPTRQDHEIVQRSLSQMGLSNLAHQSIDNLSGGQQQRVFLARALAQEPHILLMDEPFNGVDALTQETTLQLLHDLKQQQVTVLVSTHDLNMAAERFELALLLNHRLVAFGPPTDVFTTHFISEAFGTHVLYLDGAAVVDECCPHELE
jgi:ABC-type Mn2+/Zn2+ transport system ATPase subunit